jgi:hypothetical protein
MEVVARGQTDTTRATNALGVRYKDKGFMIHYTCDCCKRIIDQSDDVRYVVKMEVYASMDSATDGDSDDERDHLEEIQQILERLEDAADETLGDDVYQTMRFDLCPECRRKFLKNPLGREKSKQFDFSQN